MPTPPRKKKGGGKGGKTQMRMGGIGHRTKWHGVARGGVEMKGEGRGGVACRLFPRVQVGGQECDIRYNKQSGGTRQV